MVKHTAIAARELRSKIRSGNICYGGNEKLKIYGRLECKSGKRMKTKNRVFFISEREAIEKGYRPCGHCMKDAYKKWQINKLIIHNYPATLNRDGLI
jgi:methylphosphotriester-DNA--protein-cysteine methyltransferase